MSINMNSNQNVPTDADAYDEIIASPEEIHLEETEEELRAFLISYNGSASDGSPSRNSGRMLVANCAAQEPGRPDTAFCPTRGGLRMRRFRAKEVEVQCRE